MTLTVPEARAAVLRETRTFVETEELPLSAAAGRFLAETITADRDYPPFPRSARDGFAVRAADLPGSFTVIGEVRAGQEFFAGTVGVRQAVEIMTGAAVPSGADAVVMIEHTSRDGNMVRIERTASPGENFNPRGTEAKSGVAVLNKGHKIGFGEIAVLCSVGRSVVNVFKRPHVAIIATGDEIVEAGVQPLPHQIRNSNAFSLAAQVERAGGIADVLPIARDNAESTRDSIKHGLEADLMLLSGGVSAGKYDIVENILAEFGAEFFFDRVKIQPGQPLVFGHAQGKLFFGLPGNPISTMVTFEVFARAAIERMQGCEHPHLPLTWAPLTVAFNQKPGLTRFLPATLSEKGITLERSQGSGDVFTLARANAFLVTDPDREQWNAGDLIQCMLK